MDPNARGVLIGLGCIIAACGASLIWVLHKSAAAMDFIERHFSPDDGDVSMEVIILSVLVMIITGVAFRWEFK